MCGRNGQPSQRCQQPNTSSRISASGVQDADFVESFLLRWHRRSCFRIDGQKIYREPKGKIVRRRSNIACTRQGNKPKPCWHNGPKRAASTTLRFKSASRRIERTTNLSTTTTQRHS